MVTCTGTFNHSLISLINHWCIHSSNHISVYHCHSCMYASFPLILFVLHFLTYHAFILISWYLFQACEVLKGKLGHNQSLVVEYGADEMLPQELQDLLEDHERSASVATYNSRVANATQEESFSKEGRDSPKVRNHESARNRSS